MYSLLDLILLFVILLFGNWLIVVIGWQLVVPMLFPEAVAKRVFLAKIPLGRALLFAFVLTFFSLGFSVGKRVAEALIGG